MNSNIVELVLTLPGVIVHSEDVQQRGLPCSRRAHNRNELAGLDIQINSPQDIILRQALREKFLDVAKTNHWTSTNPLSRNSCFASSIWRRFAPVSSSTIKPSNRCTIRS